MFHALFDLDLIAGFLDQVWGYRSPPTDRCSEPPGGSPGDSAFSALRVFKAGSGHFRPVRSSFVVVMLQPWRSRLASSTDVGKQRVGLTSGSHN